MNEKDRRVRRTQKLLGEALIAVTLEKGYKNITIQDVTERADIGYRTYFRHYAGLDELLVDVAQSVLDELYELLNLPEQAGDLELIPDAANLIRESGALLFEYILENQDIFRVLLLERGVRFCLEPVMQKARKRVETIFDGLAKDSIPVPIAANHIIAATFALMRWWLENDMPHPPRQMGAIFANLIVRPTWQALVNE